MNATSYSKFYYSVGKDPADMTAEELDREIESAEEWYEDCARIGQGINTKESVRYNLCLTERSRRGHI